MDNQTDTNQQQPSSPAPSASMDGLMDSSSTPPPPPAAEQDSSPHAASGSKRPNKKTLILGLLLLLLTLPVVIFFVSQRTQIADTRDRAAYPNDCAGVLAPCTPGATSGSTACCSGQNLYCQTPAGGGQAVCQQDDGSGGDCGAGGSCSGWLAFSCGSLDSSGRCEQNPSGPYSSYSQAAAAAGGCGQVDQVCVGGTRPNTLCGDFNIINQSCGSTTGTPPPTQPPATATPTRTPTPTPNPQCGGTCSSNAQCPNNHTCSQGTCVLSQCLQNGVNCTEDNCTVLAPQCGDSCGNGLGQCPNDHTCNNGTCVLSQCLANDVTCSEDQCTVVGATPTPTPITGQCDDIRTYVNGQLVNPNTLLPGQTVRFGVVGTNATAARIRINGGDYIESTNRLDGGEFVFDYTLPSDGTIDFVIEADVQVNGVWR